MNDPNSPETNQDAGSTPAESNSDQPAINKLEKYEKKQCHKDLRDEVKLYWLIQLGTITALGALMGTWPKAADVSILDGLIIKLLILSVGMILLIVGGMYNIVGNYYTFAANFRLGRNYQESVVTPWLAGSQSVIAAILGMAMGAVICQAALSDDKRAPSAFENRDNQASGTTLTKTRTQIGWAPDGKRIEVTGRENKQEVHATTAGNANQATQNSLCATFLFLAAIIAGATGGYLTYAYAIAHVFDSVTGAKDDPPKTSEMFERFKSYSQNLGNAHPIQAREFVRHPIAFFRIWRANRKRKANVATGT